MYFYAYYVVITLHCLNNLISQSHLFQCAYDKQISHFYLNGGSELDLKKNIYIYIFRGSHRNN